MSDEPQPPAPAITERQLLVAMADIAEGLRDISLAMLIADPAGKIRRLGVGTVGIEKGLERIRSAQL